LGNTKRLIALTIAGLAIVSSAFGQVHSVAKGENDTTIAKKHGISTSQLHKLNPGVNWSRLQIGQKLKVSEAKAPAKPTAKATAQVVGTKVSGKVAEIAKTDVLMRSGPATTYDRVAKLNKGQKANVIAVKGDWYQLQFTSGTKGWIRKDMLTITSKSVPATAPKPVVASTQPEKEGEPATLPDTPEAQPTKTVITNVPEEPGAVPANKPEVPAMKPASSTPLRIEITGDRVNIRKDASTSAAKIVTVTRGRVADVLLQKNGWYKVKFMGGTIGWVHGDFVKATTPDAKDPVAAQPSAKTVSGGASDLISTAKEQIGVRYSWGGTSRGGFDCSGFVQFVFSKHGVSLPRTSISQSGTGSKVAKSDLIPGDLVFFATRGGSRVSHVGIYIGNGNFIHASSGGGHVRIDALSKDYYAKRYVGARRVGKFSKSIIDSAKAELGQKAIPEKEGPPIGE
jgi:cell wall-associated NlpC family hydrolase